MPQTGLEHFSVDLPKERARRQYGDRCGRSRFRRAQRDGCDPECRKRRSDTGKITEKCSSGAPSAYPVSVRQSALAARHLQKRFGARTVVKDISLEVKSGEIVGLLGPNGADKTTAFYMMVGL